MGPEADMIKALALASSRGHMLYQGCIRSTQQAWMQLTLQENSLFAVPACLVDMSVRKVYYTVA